ncbi:hypothetical protein Zmor_008347 [Zophobas morio]|uniref:Fibrinogen C-terminal domain-containing protein n=1 Tax=Zophobas morio TaxID=2755281 RepID=A0AA38IZK3_9CUCU|nr:hypothetical protein Zmor_008347 [Zophobas morio]
MYFKPLLLLLLIFKNVSLEESNSSDESNPHSSLYKTINDRLTKIEQQLKTNKDLEELKSQLRQIDESLDDFAEKLKKNNRLWQTLHRQIVDIRKAVKDERREHLPEDCKDVQRGGQNSSGVYTIQPDFAPVPFLVFCDMDTMGGGWAYFLNRFDGGQDFYLGWDEYKSGFGNLAGEFWLGLDRLHYLTGYEVNELLVELEDWDAQKVYARYDAFSVGDEDEEYILKLLGDYKGNAGDSLVYHAGMKFTTKDKDNDRYNAGNCGSYRGGGWWYKQCTDSHLTGKYLKGNTSPKDEYKVMYWDEFRGSDYSLKTARMMVRPLNNNGDSSEEN